MKRWLETFFTINPETLRKRNSKKNETDEQRETRLKRDRERKRKKTAEETEEDHDARLNLSNKNFFYNI